MIKRSRWLVPLLLIALGWNLGLAASAYYQHLPVVATGAPPNVQTAQIYTCQCGAAIAAVMPDGRVLLTVQDHSSGGASIVGIDDGVTFRVLDDAQARVLAPAFDFPGQKQGVGSAVYAWGKIVAYAPSRTEVGGTYNIWRYVYAPAP